MFMYYVDLFVLSAVVFRVFNAFFVFKKMFLVRLTTGCAVVFYEY